MTYSEMNLIDPLKRAIADMGFETPTNIQEEGIPLIQSGVDVIGQSQTGTGKTAAFAIPILEKVDLSLDAPQVLVLLPTRELCVQVCNEFKKLAKYMEGMKVVPVYGGDPIRNQIMSLRRGAKIIVGTPGRTIDHINRKTIRLDNVSTIILDEADEMLKMGFREDIEMVLSQVKPDRQTILFSATMPKSIIDITKLYQKNPQMIKIKSTGITTSTIKQEYCQVKEIHKSDALGRWLDTIKPTRCIVFCNTKNKVDQVTDELQALGYICEKIHGDLKQELRMNVLRKFNEGIVNVLIATDVAARGLDIKEVDVVVNYDVPDKEDYYVHRIGRSGRAGRVGMSITLVSKRELRLFENIKYYVKTDIARTKIPTIAQVNAHKAEHYVEELITQMDQINLDRLERYEGLLTTIEDKGYDLRKIAAYLFKNVLEFTEPGEHEDINDHSEETRRYGSNDRGNDRGRSGGSSYDRNRSSQGGDRSRSDARPRRYGEGSEERSEGTRRPYSSEGRSYENRSEGRSSEGRSSEGRRPYSEGRSYENRAAEGSGEVGKGKRNVTREGMTRLFINVGKSHNALAKDILGAVAGESGIPGNHIGTIDMFDKFSFIEVFEKDTPKVLKNMQDKRIKGRKVNIEEANGKQA